MTTAGRLDARITLQRPATGQDTAGQPATGWVDHLVSIAADVRFLVGLEAIKADAAAARQRASVRIRHRPGLTADMRALIDGAPFEIKSIQPIGRREWLDLVCERLAS